MTPARARRLVYRRIAKHLSDQLQVGGLDTVLAAGESLDPCLVVAAREVIDALTERGKPKRPDLVAEVKEQSEALLDAAPIALLPDGRRSPRLR